jgi:putative phosphoesterase
VKVTAAVGLAACASPSSRTPTCRGSVGRCQAALLDGFEAAAIDGIVHAGDWTDLLALTLLESIAPVDGVAGNNDGPALQERFGTRRVLELAGVRIGVTHGHLGPGATTPERARRTFDGEPGLDAIVFGHSHIPLVERQPGGTWLVNPGSPTDKRRQPSFSWALMTIEDGFVTGVELVRFADRSPR